MREETISVELTENEVYPVYVLDEHGSDTFACDVSIDLYERFKRNWAEWESIQDEIKAHCKVESWWERSK